MAYVWHHQQISLNHPTWPKKYIMIRTSTSQPRLTSLSNAALNQIQNHLLNNAPCVSSATRTRPWGASSATATTSGSISVLSSHRLTQSRLYLSDSKIEIAQNPHSGTELIQPYLRTCLKDVPLDVDANKSMEFTVSFLGTGGGAPTRNRNGSCTALRLGGQTFLFDVCEGTQRQLGFTRIWPLSITKIFISHLHGDHLFGLVPLILEIQVAAKVQSNAAGRKKKFGMSEELPVLEIYGPPGLYNYINMTLALSCAKVNYLNVTVIELVGGREERGPNALQRRGRRNVFLSHYPEIETPKIRRQYLEANENKVWVIDNPEQVTADMLEIGGDGYHRLPNDPNLGSNRRLFINAAELDHLAGVQTFGYTVEEQTPPRNIDPEKASALGLKPGKKYSLLKAGLSVPTDDGTDIVYPDQVLMEYVRPRKVAILADHRLVPAPMAQLCMDSDFLVHEATLKKSDGLDKIKMRGHTTAENAGLLSAKVGCKVVALNHFGSTVIYLDIIEDFLAEARASNKGKSQIIASYDFLEVWIPRGGFAFESEVSP